MRSSNFFYSNNWLNYFYFRSNTILMFMYSETTGSVLFTDTFKYCWRVVYKTLVYLPTRFYLTLPYNFCKLLGLLWNLNAMGYFFYGHTKKILIQRNEIDLCYTNLQQHAVQIEKSMIIYSRYNLFFVSFIILFNEKKVIHIYYDLQAGFVWSTFSIRKNTVYALHRCTYFMSRNVYNYFTKRIKVDLIEMQGKNELMCISFGLVLF